MASTSNSFGRRPVVQAQRFGRQSSGTVSASKPASWSSVEGSAGSGTRMTVTYTSRVSWMAILILVLVGVEGQDAISTLISGGPESMTSFEWQVMAAVAFAVFIALAWLLQGLRQSIALDVSANGVSGYTVFGHRYIPWTDLHSLQIVGHDLHGDFLVIHGKTRFPPARWLWLNSITIGLKHIDASLDDIVAALQTWRPDIDHPR